MAKSKLLGRVRETASGPHQWPMTEAEVREALGVKVLPLEGMPERLIQGVPVWVRPFVQRVPGRSGMSGVRVLCRCECGKVLAVGRLAQHVCKGVK